MLNWNRELNGAIWRKYQLVNSMHFESDCLPLVESAYILFYLVLETSFYTKQQFQAFQSLEGYNQMVSGFISSVQGNIIANNFFYFGKG